MTDVLDIEQAVVAPLSSRPDVKPQESSRTAADRSLSDGQRQRRWARHGTCRGKETFGRLQDDIITEGV